MPGKTPLAVLLIDDLAALLHLLAAALTDPHTPGVIDADEARPIVRHAEYCLAGGREVDLAQREGYTHTRYREPARDHAIEARDLGLDPAA